MNSVIPHFPKEKIYCLYGQGKFEGQMWIHKNFRPYVNKTKMLLLHDKKFQAIFTCDKL